MKPTLHFLCGKMAAGKTTLSKRLAFEHGAVLICEDIWLQRIFPVEISTFHEYLKYSERLKSVVAPHVTELLSKGLSVVMDFPASVPEARSWVRRIFEGADADHMLHFVNTPNARCIEQLHKRNREKPEGSMEMTVEQFESVISLFIPPLPSEGFTIKTYGEQ